MNVFLSHTSKSPYVGLSMAQIMGLDLIHDAGLHHSNENITADIVFVHGLTGSSHDTWTDSASGTFWPKDLLPSSLPNARILSWGYSSQISALATGNEISNHAENLLTSLAEERHHRLETRSPLIFVAHSLGGLIIKEALIQSYQSDRVRRDIIDATAGVVFLGTPRNVDNTDDIVRVLKYLDPLLPVEKRLALSSQLLDIQMTFERFRSRNSFPFPLVSFYEELELPLHSFESAVDKCRPPPYPTDGETHQPLPSHTILPIHADHNNICKFTDILDPAYRLVLGELKKLFARTWTQKNTWLDLVKQDCPLHLQRNNGSDRVASAFKGTLNWLFDHNSFRSWIKDSQHSIFWISGKAGSGKSTLMKFLSEGLPDKFDKSAETISVSFFFSSWSSGIDKTPRLLQSLLYQTLSQCPAGMNDHILLQSMTESQCIRPNRSGKMRSPHTSVEYLGFLEELLLKTSASKRVFLIIDGLDECSETDRADVFSLMSFVHSKSLTNPIKLCFASRNIPQYELPMEDCQYHIQKITLEDENGPDIERFVKSHVTDMIRNPEIEYRHAIAQALLTKATGTFLWVSLVLKELQWKLKHRANRVETLKRFEWTVPSNLEGVYDAILNRVMQDSQQQAPALLAWVCFAVRPLALSELRHALSIDCSYELLDPKAQQLLPSAPIEEDWLLTLCGGFLTMGALGKCVQLIHISAREYLLETKPWSALIQGNLSLLYPESVHFWLAKVCLTHIQLSYHEGKNRIKNECSHHKKDRIVDSFLEYATFYWTEHLKLADVPDADHMVVLKYLKWPSARVLGHWAHLHQKTIGNNAHSEYWGWNALHVSAAFGLESLALSVGKLQDSKLAPWDVGDANGRTPLILAADQGNLKIAKLLLDTGADINTKCTRYGFTPLHWSALNGHESMVKFLLEKGAKVDIGDSLRVPSYYSALSIASAKGRTQIVRLLLQYGADYNRLGVTNGWTALSLSAQNGYNDVVELLISWGADLSIVNPSTNQTAFYCAIAQGHKDTVKLLLERGAGASQAQASSTPETPMSWVDRVTHASMGPLCIASPSTFREHTESNTVSEPPSNSISSKRKQSNKSQQTPNKKSSNASNSEEGNKNGESGDESDESEKLKPKPNAKSESKSQRPLACPFFKFSPKSYDPHSLCAGGGMKGGWLSMARLKGHLYSAHRVHLCKKCNLSFKHEADYDTHNEEETCPQKRIRDYGEGFDLYQEKELKSRKDRKNVWRGTVSEYWYWVYRVIFPSEAFVLPESPFYGEKIWDKKSYDKTCSYERQTNADYRRAMLQARDNHDEDYLATINRIINDHQSSVRTSVPNQHQSSPVDNLVSSPSISQSPYQSIDQNSDWDTFFANALTDPSENDSAAMSFQQNSWSSALSTTQTTSSYHIEPQASGSALEAAGNGQEFIPGANLSSTQGATWTRFDPADHFDAQ